MNHLHINVVNKVASYQKRDGAIVCGNSDYQILFTFDSEWEAYAEKTARFIVNGTFTDVDFQGNTCPVPIIRNASQMEVGVYAGNLTTTTSAVIPALLSVLCGGEAPTPENDKNYANEAKEAADRAEDAAEKAEELLAEYIDVRVVGAQYQDGTGEIFNDYEGNIASGAYSHAEGVQTEAKGAGSHAEGGIYEGVRTVAHADGSHAEGGGTVTKSDGAHSEGVRTVAGRVSQKDAMSKFQAEIYPAADKLDLYIFTDEAKRAAVAKLGGFGSHAEGMMTQALGTGAHSEGSNTTAYANSTHAEGDSTLAEGEASHAEGYDTEAIGNQSHAEGCGTVANGNSAHSEGRYTKADGYASHAEGVCTYAGSSIYVFTESMDYSTRGVGTHAEGQGTVASGNSAHAEGWKTEASGQYSHAEGNNTIASGKYAHAGGVATIAGGEAQTVIGKYNVANTNTLFVVGNGTSNSNRSNAFEVYTDGSIAIGGIALTKAMLQKLISFINTLS